MSNTSIPPTFPAPSGPPMQLPPPQFAAGQFAPAPGQDAPSTGAFAYAPPAPGSAAPQQAWPAAAGAPQWTGQSHAPVPPATNKPSPLWALTIISCLGSLLFGGIGIYFSSQVGTKWAAGDVAGARKASRVAMILGICGIVTGFLFWLLFIIGIAASSGTPTT